MSKAPDGGLVAEFSSEFPLSPEGRGLVLRTLERDAALKSAAGTAGLRPAIRFREATRAPRAPTHGKALFRFSLVVVLWLALTGSLGMLLQAVVRERTNRALEILLAAARPWEIVFGKLIGVGAVSLLVLGSWLGSGAALAPLSPVAGGVFPALMTGFSEAAPGRSRSGNLCAELRLLRPGDGGRRRHGARDTAAAQNLSRPMFAVLLAAFFAALAAAGSGGAKLAWLVYLPPFTPFMLLLRAPGAYSLATQATALGLLGLCALAAAKLAMRGLVLSPGSKPTVMLKSSAPVTAA